VLCDNALIGGFAAQARPIPAGVVAEVSRDFDIGPATVASPPTRRLIGAPAQLSTPAGSPRASVERGSANAVSKPTADTRPMFASVEPVRKKRFGIF
jgi:hypothetical protein